jgi:hypothetical protein
MAETVLTTSTLAQEFLDAVLMQILAPLKIIVPIVEAAQLQAEAPALTMRILTHAVPEQPKELVIVAVLLAAIDLRAVPITKRELPPIEM